MLGVKLVVNMKSWLELDQRGADFLVRSGEGRISAVVPVGLQDSDGQFAFQRVEIDCVSPHGWARSFRFTARAQLITGSELHATSLDAANHGELVNWEIQWHRHEWVPPHVSIVDLDLDTDATARLVALESSDVEVLQTAERESQESE